MTRGDPGSESGPAWRRGCDAKPAVQTRVPASTLSARTARLAGAIASVALSVQAAMAAEGASAQLLEMVPQAATKVCNGDLDTPPVPSAKLLGSENFEARNGEGIAYQWRLPSGDLMRVTRLTTQRQPGPMYFVDVYANADSDTRRPLLRGVITGRCKFLGGQDVLYTADDPGRPYALQRLGPRMQRVREPQPLNPPVPKGTGDPACLRIAVLDNGVNYLLPAIAPHLARDASGRLIGHDYWDDDDRPMDFGYPPRSLDPRVSPFSPRHHGTGVASILIAEAPANACIAPFRYFPGDRSGGNDPREMIDDMAAAGIKIVNLSSGRDRPWPEFRDAMRAHPDMLFVLAAGNSGRDLSDQPNYPASYQADNAIVVAATDKDGSLWEQSNRGSAVDVAILAVDIPGTIYNGTQREMTGTSMAAPRVSAFAAQLLAGSPGLTGAELKKLILKRANASGKEAAGIPVLTEDTIKNR